MFKVIIALTFSFICFAENIIDKLIKMDPPPQVEQVYVKPRKFIITDEVIKRKPFTGVLKKGSLIQDLNGENFYTTKNNIVLKAIEVSESSPYVYLIGVNKAPILVSFSKDIKNIDRVVKLDYEHIPFSKEEFKYRSIDYDQIYLLNSFLTIGTHDFNYSKDSNTAHSSIGINFEAGFKDHKFIPFMITTSLNRVNGEIINWNNINFGFKVFKDWKGSNSKFSLSLEAQRTLLSSAQVFKQRTNLIENRFSIGTNYQYKKFLTSVELAKERILFPSEVNLGDLNLDNSNNYQTSIMLKLGYSFEILL